MSGTSVAVIGAGAIGGYLSAELDDAGHDVTLCVRTPIESLVVERDGDRTEHTMRIATDPSGLSPVDYVVITVKAPDTERTRPWLDALAGPDTVVAVAQNGIDHVDRVAPLVPRSKVLPLLVYITVEPLGPGLIRHSVGDRILAPAGNLGEDFAALFAGSAIEVGLSEDFLTDAWRKFLGNVVANPVTALTLRRSEVLHEEDVVLLSRTLLEEAIAVGRAEGARFAADELERMLELLAAVPPQNGTSMLFDRLAGRRLEHDLITGAVVAAGRGHDIPTPANEVLLPLLRALDRAPRIAPDDAAS